MRENQDVAGHAFAVISNDKAASGSGNRFPTFEWKQGHAIAGKLTRSRDSKD